METLERIYQHIEENPGASVSGIGRALDMHATTVDHHLRRLLRKRRITARHVGRVRAHHVVGSGLCTFLQDCNVLLRGDLAQGGVQCLLARGRLRRPDLLRLGASTSQARWTMDRLVQIGAAHPAGRGVITLDMARAPCLRRALHGGRCSDAGDPCPRRGPSVPHEASNTPHRTPPTC